MSWSDLQVGLVSIIGNVVTVSAHNPQSHAETARARVVVSLSAGGQETLTSRNFTLQASETQNLEVSASSTISSITDGPDPIEPL